MGRLRSSWYQFKRSVGKHAGLESFRLQGGGRYYYDKQAVGRELLLYGMETAETPPELWPAVPQAYEMLTRAEDIPAALSQLLDNPSNERAHAVFFPYNEHVLISERRLEPLDFAGFQEDLSK